jgi:hypothetical protein
MPENWDQVKELFTLALEREPGQRDSFLLQACAGDDTLRAEVESLLSSFDGASNFLEDCPAADLLFRAVARDDGKKRIGAYRILGEIGHGGMAVVYLAERVPTISIASASPSKCCKPGTDERRNPPAFPQRASGLGRLWTTPASCACWTVGAPKKACPI